MVRVLHVIPSVSERSGGPAMAIVPMCRALQQQGIEVLLVTTDAGLSENHKHNGDVCDYKGVPAMIFRSQLGESFKYSRPLASWLSTNVRDFGLAHIHASFNNTTVTITEKLSRLVLKQSLRRPYRPIDSRITFHISRAIRTCWCYRGCIRRRV